MHINNEHTHTRIHTPVSEIDRQHERVGFKRKNDILIANNECFQFIPLNTCIRVDQFNKANLKHKKIFEIK